jgi:NADH pyrophosphatase NudC (nudix superfamily)
VTFGESYEDAAKRELIEEIGISAPLRFLGKFMHYHPPENEMVAVFACNSDGQVRIREEESSGGKFCTKEEVEKIVVSESAPWLRDGWKLARDKI